MSDHDSTTTLFDQAGDKKDQVVSTNDQLAVLVGEGRKYKTADDLAKAYMEADAFIEKLKAEAVALKEKVASASTIDDVMARLKAEQEAGASTTSEEGTTQKGLTQADVARIVSDTIKGTETAREKETNLRKADAEMKKLFGDKATEVFNKEATTPALRETLVQLASVSPDKFVALFTGNKQAVNGGDSKTVVNTAVVNLGSDNGRKDDPTTKDYFDNLRRTNSVAYYSQAVQQQMDKAAQANPNHFFGRRQA